MEIARPTFVVQVHEEDGSAVLENVRTRERVRVHELAAIGDHIERWLGHDGEVTDEGEEHGDAGGRAGTGGDGLRW